MREREREIERERQTDRQRERETEREKGGRIKRQTETPAGLVGGHLRVKAREREKRTGAYVNGPIPRR